MKIDIDKLLNQLGDNVPKVDDSKHIDIYKKVKKNKFSLSFFNNKIKFAFVLIISVLFIGLAFNTTWIIANIGNNFGDAGKDDSVSNPGNVVKPYLKPSSNSELSLKLTNSFVDSNNNYITLEFLNQIHNQTIYLVGYSDEILNVEVDNGDVYIDSVNNYQKTFYKITFDNSNTNSHYINIYYNNNSFDRNNNKVELIMYLNYIELNKGVGYEFSINNVINKDEVSE